MSKTPPLSCELPATHPAVSDDSDDPADDDSDDNKPIAQFIHVDAEFELLLSIAEDRFQHPDGDVDIAEEIDALFELVKDVF